MHTREARVAAAEGLHARPAANFVQAAKACGVPVTIAKEGKPAVPANSILSVLSLGAKQGDLVTLAAEGPDAEAALDTLVAALEKADQ